jgi:hypothetical protein
MSPHFLTSRGHSRLLFGSCLILSGFASYLFASWAAQASKPPAKVSRSSEVSSLTLLVPSQAKLDLGILPKGGSASATFWLHNPREQTVEVGEVSTSCDCLEVSLPTKTISPGQTIMASANVDLSHDRRFVGKLRLEASGFTKSHLQASGFRNNDEGCAFFIRINVEVSP